MELTTYQKTYNEGFNAYTNGIDCPYSEIDGHLFYDWHEGYEIAEEKARIEEGLN